MKAKDTQAFCSLYEVQFVEVLPRELAVFLVFVLVEPLKVSGMGGNNHLLCIPEILGPID